MLLLTTLLTIHAEDNETNESYKTIDGRQHKTRDGRNVLTSRIIIASGGNTDVNALTDKESESDDDLTPKRENYYFSTNNSRKNTRIHPRISDEIRREKISIGFRQGQFNGSYVNGDNATNISVLHSYDPLGEKPGKSTALSHGQLNSSSITRAVGTTFQNHSTATNSSKREQKSSIDQSNGSSTARETEINANHSQSETVAPKREQKIFGINNNLGFIEEVHVFQEEGEDEAIVVEIVDEDTDDDRARVTHIYLEEKALDSAVEFGMKSIDELIRIKEPLWYNMGLVLDENDPASKVAAFGKPANDFALEVSKFGFLSLEASRKMAESFPENVSRQAAGFPGSFHPRQLQGGCPLKGTPRCSPASRRYRTADGTCNNLDNPWKGSAMLPMHRFLPPAYEDGIQTIRRSVLGPRLPSAREISVQIHGERDQELPTVTLMFMQWGQFIDHDITSVVKSRSFNGSIPRCCDRGGRATLPQEFLHPSCLPIEVPFDDWFMGQFGIRCMEFLRSAPSTRVNCDLGWREQINQVTAYIDASTIYGSDIETSDSMRTFRRGKLIYGRSHQQGPLRPPDPPGGELCRSGALTEDCFQSGDGRVAEQPGLTAMHTIWVRFHNKVATTLAKFNPHWSDEKLYQETRKVVYSIIQHITYREFLPIVLGPEVMDLFELRLVRKGYYNQYDSKINPAIANSFSTAAFRFGHSMVQNSFVRTDHKHRPLFNNVSLHEELSNFENIWSFGSVDRLLLGFANQPSQKRDEFICDELSNHLFQSSNSPFGSDLAAINIQRGRDHGLPPYTSWREPCGLSPIKKWQDLKGVFNVDSVQRFRNVYHHVDDIDLFSGGLAEKPVRGGVVGPTFACIIAQQFLNLRKGDRFWYENGGSDSAFTPAQLQQIRHVTLSQVLCQTLDEVETIQPFVFLSSDNFRNVRLPCNSPLIDNFDLSPWAERQFNDVSNRVDFKREISLSRRVKRSTKTTTRRPKTTTKTKTKTKTKRKSTSPPLNIRITNVTTSTVTLDNKYGTRPVNVDYIPSRPTHRPDSYYSDNDDSDMTYLLGIVPTKTTQKPPENPLEVNIKIQYFLPSTEKTTTTRPTRKKKKTSTRAPTNSYGDTVVITQRPPNKIPQSPGYNDFVVRPNDLFEKPTTRPRPSNIDKIPSYTSTDTKRPVHNYDRPTVDENIYNNNNKYGPVTFTGTYSYDRQTTKRPYIIRPQSSYDQTVFEDLPFSTSQRPYYYDQYPTKRPSFRPQQNGYNDNVYDYVRPQTYDVINDVYTQAFNEHDRIGDVPKKPTFGQTDYDRIHKPSIIYSIAHVNKLDNDKINDKLDFKTKLVTRPKGYENYDDRRFVKISSVKGGVFFTDRDGELYNLQERAGEMDLKEPDDNSSDKIRVVDIEISPSEIEDDQWLVYNSTDEIMPMLLVPDITKNISCSSELPKPIKTKVSQKLQVKGSRNLRLSKH